MAYTGTTPRRILLLEDNDLNREVLEDCLVECGYQIRALASSKGFFQVLADFQPHLILLDLSLPDIDGYTLLEQIQQGTDWQRDGAAGGFPTPVACDGKPVFSTGSSVGDREPEGHIPIIVVSALAFSADKQRALNLGASRYLVKPVSLKDLKEAIKDELGS